MLLDCMGGRWPLRPVLLLLLIGLFTGGCNRSTMKLYPVKGKVTYKGQPTEGASIVFQPVEGETPERPKAYGTASADGTFTLRTEPHGEGAVPGDYNVLIMWFGSASGEALDAKSKLPAKYADPANPLLKATVKEGPTELAAFALN